MRSVVYFGSYDRGAGRNAILIEGLRAVGVQVVECHAGVWRDTNDKLAAVRSGRRRAGAGARQVAAWARLTRTYRRVGEHDALVVGATAHFDLPLARRLAMARGRPLVFDPLVSVVETVRDRGLMREDGLRLAALAGFERRLLSLPDRVIVDTERHALALADELGLDLARTIVVPAGAPGCYRRLARPYPVPGARPVTRVLYFGQYIPLHGLEVVIGAAARLTHRQDIVFDLVGRGQMLPAIRALAERLELPGVRFHDTWMPEERLATDYIAKADLCLGVFGTQPKARRVVPFKVFAALASGRPVVTGDTPAANELLRSGDEVWMVPPGDSAALAEAIEWLADHHGVRARLAACGQAAYEARFAPRVLGGRLWAEVERLAPPAPIERIRHTGPVRHEQDRADGGLGGAYTGPRHVWRIERVADRLREAAPKGMLLDAGCGTGSLSVRLRSAGRQVCAFDRDLDRLRVALGRAGAAGVDERVWIVCADVRAVPFREGVFAGVAASEVLEHVAADGDAVRELARVVAPGGALVVSVPAGPGRFGAFDRSVGHVRRYDRRGLSGLWRVPVCGSSA